MDKGLSSVMVRKLHASLTNAQNIFNTVYSHELPVSAIQILCIVYKNHMLGQPTFISELEKELHMTIPSISRQVSKLAIWSNLKTRGAGFLNKEKAYNDEGYQVNAISITEQGIAVVHRILEPLME